MGSGEPGVISVCFSFTENGESAQGDVFSLKSLSSDVKFKCACLVRKQDRSSVVLRVILTFKIHYSQFR